MPIQYVANIQATLEKMYVVENHAVTDDTVYLRNLNKNDIETTYRALYKLFI